MVVAVGLVRPYFTGWEYQDHTYQTVNRPNIPATLDDSDQFHTDYRNRFNGQFTGSSADPMTYALDMSYNSGANTWDKHYGGNAVFYTVWNPYEILSMKPVLDKYTSALNYTIAILDDRDVNNNSAAFTGKDVLIFGHGEYFTQAMYDNLKSWISNNGGTCIFMDGNVMFALCTYDSAATPPKLVQVDGHFNRWHPTTQSLNTRSAEFPTQTGTQIWEHWTVNGKNENGTTPTDAGEKESYWNFIYKIDPTTGEAVDPNGEQPITPTATSSSTLYRSPYFRNSTHEDDYIVDNTNPNIVTIHDYGVAKKTIAANPQRDIRCWYQNKGHGRILHMGIYCDQFFDTAHGANRPLKAFYHWWMKKVAKPYFVTKPVTP